MDWLKLAWDLLQAPATDAVRLAWMEDPQGLEGLDLRALAEYERKPGGAVRVKLMDRAAGLAALLRSDLLRPDPDPEAAARFFAALDGATKGDETDV